MSMQSQVAVVTARRPVLVVVSRSVLAEAGADVVAAARRLDRLETLASESERIVPVECDVSVEGGPRTLVATTIERFGRIDVCVNNAGSRRRTLRGRPI